MLLVASMIRTRAATVADTPFLRDLHHAAYRDLIVRQFGSWDASAQDAFFDQSLRDADYQLVFDGEIPVGAVATRLHADHLFLAEMQVLPEHQNRGIGTLLLNAQIQRAAEHDKPLGLQVLRENRARALYERHGFTGIGETETHYLMLRPRVGSVLK